MFNSSEFEWGKREAEPDNRPSQFIDDGHERRHQRVRVYASGHRGPDQLMGNCDVRIDASFINYASTFLVTAASSYATKCKEIQ